MDSMIQPLQNFKGRYLEEEGDQQQGGLKSSNQGEGTALAQHSSFLQKLIVGTRAR